MRHKIKYPKLLLLLLTILIAILLFYEGKNYAPFHKFLLSLGYTGIFFGGFFYAYGFTAAPATAVLLVLSREYNIIVAALVGGVGALLSDLMIFLFIRHSLIDEIKKLKKEKIVKYFRKNETKVFSNYAKYIAPAFAGFLIASPLPTEIGVSILAGIRRIPTKKFIVVAYTLHTLGILTILVIGNIS